ncbi:hypothetical protein BOO69_07275 [Sulfitobacter alexandrii]|uniref:Uncharacterized protein n=1 Tax=Sulfitobacter alexandrii TaxID=1917485 RepID=A0A1J0WGI1_9RHOB|nr:hypothetical protein BOO69_07275 [Sulfitobacter alexandrii]
MRCVGDICKDRRYTIVFRANLFSLELKNLTGTRLYERQLEACVDYTFGFQKNWAPGNYPKDVL